MRLVSWSALAFLTLASPGALADQTRKVPAVTPQVIDVLGKRWCIGDVGGETSCDLRLLPDASRPAPAPSAFAPLRRVLDQLASELRTPRGESSPAAGAGPEAR
jgi:hypothetical protein